MKTFGDSVNADNNTTRND